MLNQLKHKIDFSRWQVKTLFHSSSTRFDVCKTERSNSSLLIWSVQHLSTRKSWICFFIIFVFIFLFSMYFIDEFCLGNKFYLILSSNLRKFIGIFVQCRRILAELVVLQMKQLNSIKLVRKSFFFSHQKKFVKRNFDFDRNFYLRKFFFQSTKIKETTIVDPKREDISTGWFSVKFDNGRRPSRPTRTVKLILCKKWAQIPKDTKSKAELIE